MTSSDDVIRACAPDCVNPECPHYAVRLEGPGLDQYSEVIIGGKLFIRKDILCAPPSTLDDAALREVLAEAVKSKMPAWWATVRSEGNRNFVDMECALAAMRRVSTPAQQVTEHLAWEILRTRITGFGKDHGDGHFDDSCERCALISELDAILLPKPQQE